MWLFEEFPRARHALIFTVFFVSFCSSIASPKAFKVDTRSAAKSSPCYCVPYYHCDAESTMITNGQGLIDIKKARMHPNMDTMCEDPLEICCRLPEPANNSSRCGRRRISEFQERVARLDKDVAFEGEFPWMVTIFRAKSVEQKNVTIVKKVYQCQGTLINEKVVLTTAQCVRKSGNNVEQMSIRAGQDDTMMTNEEMVYQEREVQEVIVHRGFDSVKLKNNIALLILQEPVILNRHVDITCLAGRGDDTDVDKCLSIGWDKFLGPEDAKTQRIQTNMLRRRLQPFDSSPACTSMLNKTPLGRGFKLDKSSVCAGGSLGDNFCSRETGGPLACPLKSDPTRYVQVGIASWCINYGGSETPNVFASVSQKRRWIDNQMAKRRLDASVYRATIN